MKLLIFSSVRWNFMWQRHHSIASAACRAGWEVDFVEPPVRGAPHAGTAVRARLARDRPPPTAPNPIPDGVNVITPPLSFWFLPRASQRRWLTARVSGPYDACILYLPTRSLVAHAERVARRLTYDNVVDWGHAPSDWFPPNDWRSAESSMRRGRWREVTDSPLVATSNGASLVLPAADDPFLDFDWSPPIAGGPLIYFGSVRTTEIDIDLLASWARQGIPVEVIGPLDSVATRTRLTSAGVICRPPVASAELPGHLDRSSGLVLPYDAQRRETLIPAKLWNCLATNRQLLARGLNIPEAARSGFTEIPSGNEDAASLARQTTDRPLARAPERVGWDHRWLEMVEQQR